MAWENRGNGRYYYRKARRAGRVFSEYMGRGEVTGMIAALEEIEQEKKSWEKFERRQMLEEEAAQEQTLDEIGSMVRSITRAALLAAGCHTHNRQWRRKRDVSNG